MKLGISIVDFNSDSMTSALLVQLTAQEGFAKSLSFCVVLNGASSPNLEAVVERARVAGFSIKVFIGHGNIGYAAGNNLACRYLLLESVNYLWILNPDVSLASGALPNLLESLKRVNVSLAATRDVDAIGERPGMGSVNTLTGRTNPFSPAHSAAFSLAFVAGHSVVFSAVAFQELDGFCEDFFLFYEEADLAIRAAAQGIPLQVLEGVSVNHSKGGTTGASMDLGAKSLVAFHHGARSCVIFFRKHYPRRVPFIVLLRATYACVLLIRSRNPTAAKAVLRGVASGLRSEL